MTDPANAIDQAERIRRLQERRAASGRPPRDAAPRAELQGGEGGALPAAAPRRPRPRRRHPAAATRWLLGGLSVASFFTIAGTVAVANLGSGTAAQPTPPAAQVAAAPVVAAPVAPRRGYRASTQRERPLGGRARRHPATDGVGRTRSSRPCAAHDDTRQLKSRPP